jgi:3-oxoacyl-[acyl-carrier protein] reductase
MDLGLRGKVALVAAASKGLGRAVAHELAVEGARVVMCARGRDALETAREEIAKDTNADVRAVVADVSTMNGIETVARLALDAYGRVDVLVNNAGGPPSGPFEKHPWSEWEKAVQLTLRSAVELTRHVLPGMRERKWGRVVNITSIAVKQPVDGLMLSMRRMGDAREFAAMVAFLASERASYITAQSIPVDGGWIRSLV